jgi:hypothetical protein
MPPPTPPWERTPGPAKRGYSGNGWTATSSISGAPSRSSPGRQRRGTHLSGMDVCSVMDACECRPSSAATRQGSGGSLLRQGRVPYGD